MQVLSEIDQKGNLAILLKNLTDNIKIRFIELIQPSRSATNKEKTIVKFQMIVKADTDICVNYCDIQDVTMVIYPKQVDTIALQGKVIYTSYKTKVLFPENEPVYSDALEAVNNFKAKEENFQKLSEQEKTISKWVDLFEKKIKNNDKYEDLFSTIGKDPSVLFSIGSKLDKSTISSSLDQMKKRKEIIQRLYTQSAEQNYGLAIAELPMFFCMNRDFERAIYWEKIGVKAQVPECMFFRGMRLIVGKDFDGRTQKDMVEGLKWLLIASDLNDEQALEVVSMMMKTQSQDEREIMKKAIQRASAWQKEHLH